MPSELLLLLLLLLLSFVPEYQQIRTFAVERIETIEKLREPFDKPADFSIDSHMESAFGVIREEPFDIEVIFGPDVSEYVRSRVWHPSQRVRELSRRPNKHEDACGR